MLIHVSEESDIKRFEPRTSECTNEPVVWAINTSRIYNYLVPRKCPRVTYYGGPSTSPGDIERFLGSSLAIVAVESRWLNRIQSCRLYFYHLPPETFECIDECAGYFVSHDAVIPERVQFVDNPLADLLGMDVELRLMPELWSLRNAVVASTLSYSVIRMRNAQPTLPA